MRREGGQACAHTRCGPCGRRGERGSVLVVAVLVAVALELLAHGALLMARQEALASRAGLRVLRLRAAAEAGVRAGPLSSVGRPYRTVPLWMPLEIASTGLGSTTSETWLRRLSRESWLVEGRGRKGPGPSLYSDLGLAWLPDPAGRVAAFHGVVEVGPTAPVAVQGRVETEGIRRDRAPLDAVPCRPWLATLDSIFGAGAPPAVTRVSMGDEPSLGALGSTDLLAQVPQGDPSTDRYLPRSGASLLLEGGTTRGLLVVSGDLEMEGAHHEGMVLVGGRLVLRDGAVLVGMARAAGGLDVDAGSAVVGSGCRALLAVDGGLAEWARPLLLVPGGLGPW